VTDTGMGIAPEKIAMLFKPFSQVDNAKARKSSGTGRGLSIVRRIAQLMEGDAGVTSEPGTGSRFWIRLRATRVGSRPAPPHGRRCGARASAGVPCQRAAAGSMASRVAR
jgi:K+-sensing histidine kinase KdpD